MILELDTTSTKSKVSTSIHIINYETNNLSDEEKMYVPTDIFGTFRYVLNKQKNIFSIRAIKT
jgi:hypothetical protein